MTSWLQVVEQPAEPAWLPGAKALDLMDCALELRRQVIQETVSRRSGQPHLHLRVRYSMPRAYFVALPLSAECELAQLLRLLSAACCLLPAVCCLLPAGHAVLPTRTHRPPAPSLRPQPPPPAPAPGPQKLIASFSVSSKLLCIHC